MVKRIGVLTGGGDCPGLNAVIRAVVRTAMLKYGYEVFGYKNGYRGLVLNDFVKFTSDDVSGILDKGGTLLGTSNRDNPFKFKVEKNGDIKYMDMSDRIIENMGIFGVDALVVIGGDGTLKGAERLYQKGVKVIGIPKTIDNDISSTDFAVGFMTAVDIATDAVDKLHSTAESYHRVMILEVTGRHAGWTALEAGIAGGADVILIPEIPYDINKVAQKILERRNAGKHFSIVIASEGAKCIDGKITVETPEDEHSDRIKHDGIGTRLADYLENLTGIESRVTVLGHLQRGGRPIPYDRILSTRYGVAAVESAECGKFGTVVSIQQNRITHVTFEEAVSKRKQVPPDGELVRIAKSVGVGFGD